MRGTRLALPSLLIVFAIVALFPAGVYAQTKYPHPDKYIPTWAEMESHKRFYNDPRPVLKEFGLKQILPKDFYDRITFDQEKMKAAWSELIGFRAPDVVGKIHPEIKPGKYTYKDLAQNPGWKKLIIPELYDRIHPPSGVHAGSFQEFELIPTRQYYWALPIAEMTKRNINKCKLDAKGYLVQGCWEGGFPFPRPSGQFKAQQVMYTFEKQTNYFKWNQNSYSVTRLVGFNANRKVDFDGKFNARNIGLIGRALMEPYGYYDARAKQLGEQDQALLAFESPRDQAGQLIQQTRYVDRDKPGQTLVYIPAFRRVRKMSGTDTQDAIAGQDSIYDDNVQWSQKLSPDRYPYKYELIDEREYIVVAPSIDGAETLDATTYEYKNMRLERRPMYVLRLTQLDKNYVYGQRILYIDKETFHIHHMSNYDQRGRLYRTLEFSMAWFPEVGMFAWWAAQNISMDHVDRHTTITAPWDLPAVWGRDDLRLSGGQGQK